MNSTWELQNLSKKYEINEGSLAISQWFRWDFASLARRLGHARPMAEDSPKTPSKANSLGSGLGEVSASRCKSFRSATEPSSTTLDKTFWQTVDSVYIYICTNLHHIFLTNFMAQFSYHVFFVHTEKNSRWNRLSKHSFHCFCVVANAHRLVNAIHCVARAMVLGKLTKLVIDTAGLVGKSENRFYHGFLTCFWPWRS